MNNLICILIALVAILLLFFVKKFLVEPIEIAVLVITLIIVAYTFLTLYVVI